MAVSCSSDSTDMPDVSEGSEVTFDVKNLTRASTVTSFNHFVVYGDMENTKVSDADPVIIFDKTLVKYSDGNWSYEGTRYWFPDYVHSFVAVYPLSVLEPDDSPQYSNSKLSFPYTLPLSDDGLVDDKNVTDIIAATYRKVYDESSPSSPVVLRFSHLLAQINFSLALTEPSRRSEECIKIHKLEMSGFGTSATFNIKPAPTLDSQQTNDSETEITTAKGNGSLRISFAEPIVVSNGDSSIKMFDGNNAILMLPQTFSADDKVQIRITYSADNETETDEMVGTLSGFTWESGKSYNYKINLELKDANMVISNAIITPWTLIDDHDEVNAR